MSVVFVFLRCKNIAFALHEQIFGRFFLPTAERRADFARFEGMELKIYINLLRRCVFAIYEIK